MPNISCTCAVLGSVLEKEYALQFVFLQILVDCIEPNIFNVDLGMKICNVETDGQNLHNIHYYFFVSKTHEWVKVWKTIAVETHDLASSRRSIGHDNLSV